MLPSQLRECACVLFIGGEKMIMPTRCIEELEALIYRICSLLLQSSQWDGDESRQLIDTYVYLQSQILAPFRFVCKLWIHLLGSWILWALGSRTFAILHQHGHLHPWVPYGDRATHSIISILRSGYHHTQPRKLKCQSRCSSRYRRAQPMVNIKLMAMRHAYKDCLPFRTRWSFRKSHNGDDPQWETRLVRKITINSEISEGVSM